MDDNIEQLKIEIEKLKHENTDLKSKLYKYTNPDRNKKFYEKNKEAYIKRANERLKSLPPEKLKEYRQRAYQKRKAKLKEKAI